MQARWVAMHASRMKGVQVEVKQLDDMEKAGMVGRVKIIENDLHQIKTSVQSWRLFAKNSEDCNLPKSQKAAEVAHHSDRTSSSGVQRRFVHKAESSDE